MITGVLVILLTCVAAVCVAFAYESNRRYQAMQAARFEVTLRRLQGLEAAVSQFRGAVQTDFGATDDAVKSAARDAVLVLERAIARESALVQASSGRNARAIAALAALLQAAQSSTQDMVSKLSAQDSAAAQQYLAIMEARHQEIVSYLSGGGMETVANALQAAVQAVDGAPAEHFSGTDLQNALTSVGITLSSTQIAGLFAGVQSDMSIGLTLREALYRRLSALAPVVSSARAAAVAAQQAAQQAAQAAQQQVATQLADVQTANYQALLASMNSQYASVQAQNNALAQQMAQLSASDAASSQTLQAAVAGVGQQVLAVGAGASQYATQLAAIQAALTSLSPAAAPSVPAAAAVPATATATVPATAAVPVTASA